MPKLRPHVRPTLLIIGEGPHDAAFLKHIKSLFAAPALKVTIDAGNGGSPYDVINHAVRYRGGAAFDRKVVLLDSDVSIAGAALQLARTHSVTVLQSTPVCLEGMLLRILGSRTPASSELCKAALHPRLSGPPTDQVSYAGLFTQPLLEGCDHDVITQLKLLLSGNA